MYHQIYHEKPIYGGHESRVSYETMEHTRTYFLNFFHAVGGSNNDIIKQDISIHGLALFDYFDIRMACRQEKLADLPPSQLPPGQTIRKIQRRTTQKF